MNPELAEFRARTAYAWGLASLLSEIDDALAYAAECGSMTSP